MKTDPFETPCNITLNLLIHELKRFKLYQQTLLEYNPFFRIFYSYFEEIT